MLTLKKFAFLPSLPGNSFVLLICRVRVFLLVVT